METFTSGIAITNLPRCKFLSQRRSSNFCYWFFTVRWTTFVSGWQGQCPFLNAFQLFASCIYSWQVGPQKRPKTTLILWRVFLSEERHHTQWTHFQHDSRPSMSTVSLFGMAQTYWHHSSIDILKSVNVYRYDLYVINLVVVRSFFVHDFEYNCRF